MAEPGATQGGEAASHPDGGHIFAELVSGEGLTSPIRASGRIKYTCIGVSKHYIGLGASSGGLYVFHRSTLKYFQVFSNTEGALTRVSFAPDDNIVGIATSQGLVIAWELNVEKRERPTRLAVSSAHRHGNVTSMAWDAASERLFAGDNHGRITFLNVYHRKMSGLFKLPTELVMDADSPIVQLDYSDDKLLASTTTKCFICDTKKKHAYPVGTKLRDGQFGACFLPKASKEFPLIYSARPGSRMWEVNIVGQVQATHQFKQLLAIPSLPVMGPGHSPVFPSPEHVQKPQSLNFSQLLTFGHGHNLLLTWNTSAIYVFDPAHIRVMVWSMDVKDILWACVYKSRVYCLHPNSQVGCYSLLSAERCISKLFALSQWEQCAAAAVYFAGRVREASARRYVPRSLVQEVNYQLMDGSTDHGLMRRMEELLSNMEEDGLSTPGSSRRSSLDSSEGVRLDSGIYRVRNRAGSDDSVEDFTVQSARPALFVDQETQIDDGEGYEVQTTGKNDSQVDKDLAVFSDTKVQEELKAEETREKGGPVDGLDQDAGDEDAEVGRGSDGDEEEVGGPGEGMTGPAGINWGFGQGRLPLRRENSLLEEIAEKSEEDDMDALVKDGELDTRIAEALNFADDAPATDTHTDPQADASGGDQTSETDPPEGEASGGSLGHQRDSTIQDDEDGTSSSCHHSCLDSSANSEDTASSTDQKNDGAADSLPPHSTGDHLRTGPATDHQESDVDRHPTDANRLAPREHSQSGAPIPNQATSPPESPDGEEVPSFQAGGSHDAPVESDRTQDPDTEGFRKDDIGADFKVGPILEENGVVESDWPAIRRSVSMPTGSQQGANSDGRKGRKSSTGKDRRRSKKSRIIDFDNPEKSTKAYPISTSTAPLKDTYQQQSSKTVIKSTPTKRSLSLSALPSPSPGPSKLSSQADLPPSGRVDSTLSSSFASRAVMGGGPFDSNEEVFLGGSSMMFAMSGPRIAAQILAPSFSAMKESLSSKLVKTKTFLKQMSEPDTGTSPSDEVAVTIQPDGTSQMTLLHPSWDPTITLQHSAPNTPSESFQSFPETAPQPVAPSSKRSLLKRASLGGASGGRKTWFDEDEAKADYCSELADDAAIKKLAIATWKTKRKLQDPGVLLSIDGCRDILEKWLAELQTALASQHHPLHADSYEEVPQTNRAAKSLIQDTSNLVVTGIDELHEDLGNDDKERREPVFGGGCASQPDDSLESSESIELGYTPSDSHTLRKNTVFVHTKRRVRSLHQLSDPFGLPTEILEDLSKLASLCFEMGLYGSDDITPASCTVQSELSDNERSGSFQDGESSSPETDQSYPVLESNMNFCRLSTLVRSTLTGHPHESPQGGAEKTNQSNCSSDDIKSNGDLDNGIQGRLSMETETLLMSEQDTRAASFVTSFFFLLEVERVRLILKSREGQRSQTMAAILNCLEAFEGESDSKGERKSRNSKTNKRDLGKENHASLSHIHRLIQHGEAARALDIMLGSFPDLAPWEVMHLTQADTVPSTCFLDYVTSLLDSVELIDRETLLASICSDQEVKCHVLTSALSQGAPSVAELFCTCRSLPRPGSHLKEWQYGTLADHVLSLPGSDKDRLLKLCLEHGYWSGLIRLLLELQQRGQVLEIVLQLADMKFITKDGVMPVNMDEWITLLNLMSRSQPVSKSVQCLACGAPLLTNQDGRWTAAPATGASPPSDEGCDWSSLGDSSSSKPECDWVTDGETAPHQEESAPQSDWSPSVTWESVSALLVKSVGPGLATRMLQDTGIPSGELTRGFFKTCVNIGIIEKYERVVCQSMLEGLAIYLWSKRNNTLSPWLHHEAVQEQMLRMTNRDVDPETALSRVSREEGISQESFQFVEDLDCHWGTSALLNRDCEVCGLALSSSVSTRTPGLVVFPCGHAFHSACVVEKACVLCYEISCHKTYADSRYV